MVLYMQYQDTILDQNGTEWNFECEVSGWPSWESVDSDRGDMGGYVIKDFEFDCGKIWREGIGMRIEIAIHSLDKDRSFPHIFKDQTIYSLKNDIYTFIADNHEAYVYEE